MVVLDVNPEVAYLFRHNSIKSNKVIDNEYKLLEELNNLILLILFHLKDQYIIKQKYFPIKLET